MVGYIESLEPLCFFIRGSDKVGVCTIGYYKVQHSFFRKITWIIGFKDDVQIVGSVHRSHQDWVLLKYLCIAELEASGSRAFGEAWCLENREVPVFWKFRTSHPMH